MQNLVLTRFQFQLHVLKDILFKTMHVLLVNLESLHVLVLIPIKLYHVLIHSHFQILLVQLVLLSIVNRVCHLINQFAQFAIPAILQLKDYRFVIIVILQINLYVQFVLLQHIVLLAHLLITIRTELVYNVKLDVKFVFHQLYAYKANKDIIKATDLLINVPQLREFLLVFHKHQLLHAPKDISIYQHNKNAKLALKVVPHVMQMDVKLVSVFIT